jgi:pimeloyl-ACP methyl ester carboxylesterase
VLHNINIPVLILWGRHDEYIRLSFGYRLSEDIKGSKIEIIDKAGHFLPEDQPVLTAELMDRFIKEI